MALMYQKPDFLWSKYSCADYVGLRLASPSHSLSISLFLSYNFSLSQDVIVKRCKKKKKKRTDVSAVYNFSVQLQYINCFVGVGATYIWC